VCVWNVTTRLPVIRIQQLILLLDAEPDVAIVTQRKHNAGKTALLRAEWREKITADIFDTIRMPIASFRIKTLSDVFVLDTIRMSGQTDEETDKRTKLPRHIHTFCVW